MLMNVFSILATSSVQPASNTVDKIFRSQKTIDGVLFNVHQIDKYFIFIRRKYIKHKIINDIKNICRWKT
jgi:conjugal transfer/entry exclusion protein